MTLVERELLAVAMYGQYAQLSAHAGEGHGGSWFGIPLLERRKWRRIAQSMYEEALKEGP